MTFWESISLSGAQPRQNEQQRPVRQIKILVVDDDPQILNLVETMLVSEGEQVVTAANGLDALDKFILEQPDLVLMDINMPGMNGFEATAKIKSLVEREKWVPVIMVSGLNELNDFARGLEAGADDYLTKPFTPALLSTKIQFMKRVLAIQADLFTLKRFQAIFDHVLDGIVATNEQGIIVSFNFAAEKIFGYRADEVLGRNVSVLMPIPEAHRHDAYMARYEYSGQATVMGQGRDIHGRRKDGSIIPISVGLTEVQWAGSRHFIGAISDISDRKQAERFQHELASQLNNYRAQNEEERKITQELLRRIIRADSLQDPLLQWHLRPSEAFSGDIIAAHRSQEGRFLVLIADGTGHGLAAAISLLPLMGIFYTMADKGFHISSIASEINKRLYETMPIGRFVAAALIAVYEDKRQFEIWNGGMPDILYCKDEGSCERLRGNHMALGILSPGEFDKTCHTHTWQHSGYLVAMSDGIIEAENRAGAPLSLDSVSNTAISVPGGNPFAQILQHLERHLSGAVPHDDISLAAIRLN